MVGQTTEDLSRHFRKMAERLLEHVENENLAAIMLETPTNVYDHDGEEDERRMGLSVMDIAIEHRMLEFLRNETISRLATTLWYERKIVHPWRRFGHELTYYETWNRLINQPAKFFFSPSGFNVVEMALYACHLVLLKVVTSQLKDNVDDGIPMGMC